MICSVNKIKSIDHFHIHIKKENFNVKETYEMISCNQKEKVRSHPTAYRLPSTNPCAFIWSWSTIHIPVSDLPNTQTHHRLLFHALHITTCANINKTNLTTFISCLIHSRNCHLKKLCHSYFRLCTSLIAQALPLNKYSQNTRPGAHLVSQSLLSNCSTIALQQQSD
jgi:hypothetical protein